jgi:hypothetical protein
MIQETLVNLKIAKEKQKNINIWDNSLFDGIQNLTIDQSGFVGEKSFFDLANKCKNIVIDYDSSNTDQPDGIYEGSIGVIGDEKIKVNITNDKFKETSKRSLYRYPNRTETKTARLGVNNSFQHEKIKDSSYTDFIVFIDYSPNSVFLTILKTSDMDFSCQTRHPIINRKMHHRKKEDSYKFDIGMKGIKNCIKNGITLEINQYTDDNTIHNFIESFFIKNPLL